MSNQNKISFQKVIDALLDDDADFPVEYFTAFSDLEGEDYRALLEVWNQITPARKVNLLEHLEVINEVDTLVDFSEIAKLAMHDNNGIVRASAIRILWEYDDEKMISKLIDLLIHDPELSVRVQAAGALGKYVYLGEVEEIQAENLKKTEEALISVMKSSESELIRQKALESLGFSSREEVSSFITNAYQSPDYGWISSSLIAMGRSADEKWGKKVLPMLAHPEERIQREAIFAAGELELQSARRLLLKNVIEGAVDEEIWVTSVNALSKIGGEGVHDVFEKLLERADTDEEKDFLQEAIDNLYLTEGVLQGFDLFDIDDPQHHKMHETSLDEEIDLDQLEDSWIDQLENNLLDEMGLEEEESLDDLEDEDSYDDLEDE